MSLNRLSLRDLQYAVAVADELHFGRAAQRCHVSQPALSAQIRKLEEALGIALFERSSRAVLVTAQGAAVITQARRLLEEAQLLLDLAKQSETFAGELRIDAIATLGPYLFPHILRPLRQRFPDVDFVLREGRTETILAALTAGRTDVALLSLPVADEGLAILPLFEEPFVLIHPPGMLGETRPPVTIDALEEGELLLLEEGHCLRDQALDLCRPGRPRSHRHATSLDTLRHMVAAGAGYSLLPALAALSQETFGGLVAYSEIGDAGAARQVALAFRASDPRGGHYETLAATIRASLPDAVTVIGAGTAGKESTAL
jgi:LysR family hydrogen peroxide-inducible transcriptional activator